MSDIGISIDAVPAVPAPRRRVRGRRIVFDPYLILMALALLAGIAWCVFTPWPNRAVTMPTVTIIEFAVLYVVVIYRRDRALPVFEVGSIWVAAAFFYAAYPMINFIANGYAWHEYSSDWRLSSKASTPQLVGGFGWRYALYYGCFIVTYLLIRGRATVRTTEVDPPGRSRVIAQVSMLVALEIFLFAIAKAYHFEYNPPYTQVMSGEVQTISSLPHAVLQFVQTFHHIRFTLLQFLIPVVLLRWKDWRYRWLLIGSVVLNILYAAARNASRSELVLLMLTTILMYHRLVKPLKLKLAILLGVGFIGGFLLLGVMRNRSFGPGYDEVHVPFLVVNNEFQAVWGTSYDIWALKRDGIITNPPPQLFFSDFYFLVPSQLLPFEKIDPSAWYLQTAGIENVGLMFGAVGQAVLGFDWPEIFVRSVLLAAICAFLHRWYVRHYREWWTNMFYLFVSVWMYYSMRQTSFASLYFIVYWFIPIRLAIETLALVMRRARNRMHLMMQPS
jgi:hypothetical protein